MLKGMRVRVALLLGASLFAPLASGDSTEERWEARWLRVKLSAYCAGPCKRCGTNGEQTSSGRDARKDGCATDPEVIPTGSRLDIPGIDLGPNSNGSWIIADDVGGLVRGLHVDIRMQGNDHEENKKWGIKKRRIRVWMRVK